MMTQQQDDRLMEPSSAKTGDKCQADCAVVTGDRSAEELLAINDVIDSIGQFKELMWRTQALRRCIVRAMLDQKSIASIWLHALRHSHKLLSAGISVEFLRNLRTCDLDGGRFSLMNIRDEVNGLSKDVQYLEGVAVGLNENSTRENSQNITRNVAENRNINNNNNNNNENNENENQVPEFGQNSQKNIVEERKMPSDKCCRMEAAINCLDFDSILAPFHPVSKEMFSREKDDCKRLLTDFIDFGSNGRKPLLVTDWDGTMKDYCSQYATNLQPVYSAVGLVHFAERFTRLTAVLTAGPLRGPGILDLTAIPLDGPVRFSGSWGREWWMSGKRVVHNDGISEEGFDALNRFNDEMDVLLQHNDYKQFALVGSGVQRKVDRITLGVQTVCGNIGSELRQRYEREIRERMYRVDPYNKCLIWEPSTNLEVEVVVADSSDRRIWNKADGVERVIDMLEDSLEVPGRVLICGDTHSDLPMVKRAAEKNPQGVMALFVGAGQGLRDQVSGLVADSNRTSFVACPDVIHAAMAQILAERSENCK